MAAVPPLIAFWAIYGTQIIISLSFMAVSMGLSLALSYLNRAKTHKSIFDSTTYHENGMINNIQPGTPKNIVYGEHRIPPSIINKYSYAVTHEHGDSNHTDTEILCSLGEETTGVWGIRVNDQSVTSAYKNGKGLRMWWAPGGRTNQLIYESRNSRKGSLTGAISAGFNVTINFNYDNGNDKHPFQGDANNEESPTVSAIRPGYVLIYKDGTKGHYEVVRYEGIVANGGEWQLTGCLVTKSHVNGSTIQQDWQLGYKEDTTTPLNIMPPFGKNVTEQRDLNGGSGTLLDYDDSWCPAVTTNNKIRSFAVTVGWEKGLYGIEEGGYEQKSCGYQIRWRKVGGSWTTTYDDTTKTLHDTADSGLYIIIEKNAKYAYVVNADGSYYTEFANNMGNHGLKKKNPAGRNKIDRYKLVFDGKKQSEDYTWTLPKEEDKSIEFEYETDETSYQYVGGEDRYDYKYRVKIKFNTSKEKYTGPTIKSTSPKAFKITYRNRNANNFFAGEASPSNAVTASYRLTHQLPDKEPLDYAKYEIQVRKTWKDIDNLEDGQNEMRWLTLQEMDNDALEYPYESLLGFRLKMTEKINSIIENITCLVQGKAVTDVQNASNVWAASTAMSVGQFRRPTVWDNTLYRVRSVTGNAQTGSSEPTWLDIGLITDNNVTWEVANRFSYNPLDICADIIMSKRYGRGKYLELTNDRITAFYDKYKTEAAFADEVITENGTGRRRFNLNFNLDFRGPLIDLLQSIGATFRGKFYFDGEIPICYIDRKKTPTAMFCMGNIVEDSYKPEALSLSDNINRLQAQFLDKDKNYTQNTDQADIVSVDSSWTVNKLMDKVIALYGLTKKWYIRKILNYMLRFAWYTRNSTSFQTTLDGLSCDIGDTFYCHDDTMNLTAQSGRIIAVGSNYIDMDKAFTFVVATTYKALLRQNTGVPQVELTVDLVATGTGAKTRVYFTQAVLNTVEANSIYILGTGTYYMTFRCVQRGFRGNIIEIGALEYNEEVYRIYKNDTSDPAWTGDTDEIISAKDTALPSNIVPPEIPNMVLVESRSTFGEIEVHLRVPVGNLEWHHADIYYQEEGESDWTYVKGTRGEPVKIGNLRIGKEYDVKAISISPSGIANNNEVTATITLKGDSDIFVPNPITGIQLIGDKGSELNVSGSDFEFKWNKDSKLSGDDSTPNYVKHAGLSNIYENLRYRIAVYFSDIPITVKHGSILVQNKIVHEEIVTEIHYRFRLGQNIEAAKDLWKDYSTHASYATYYGKPNRTCRFVIQAINGYGNVSAESEITLTNPAPDMNDSTGANTTPVLKALKSGVRVKFIHPYQEYDISHFMVQYAEVDFTNPLYVNTLKKIRVSSAITVNSTDDELDSTQYKVDIDGLDPKKTYYVRVRPHDTYGAGTFSGTASIAPGVTDDDAEEDIAKPGTISGLAFTVLNNNNLKGSWTLLADIDTSEYIYDWRGVNDTTATEPPTLTEVENGITAGGKDCYGVKSSVMVKDGDETATKNWFVIQNPKNGYKYFFKVRGKNTSRKLGAWQSSWTTHSTAISGITHSDFAEMYRMYSYAGTISTNAYNKVSWTAANLKFRAGSTYAIAVATNQTVTGTMILGWVSTASTQFSLIDYSTFYSNSTYDSYVAIAIVEENSDTSGECTVVPFEGKDYRITASLITAGAIIAGKIATGAVTAVKISVANLASIISDLGAATAGSLTLTHDGGGYLKFKDSTGKVGIRIRVNSSSDPDIVVMKSGQDADNASDAEDPDKVAFSTKLTINSNAVRPKTPLIIEFFNAQINSSTEMPAITSGGGYNANSSNNSSPQVKYFTSTSGTAKRRISADLSIVGGYTFPLPYINIVSINSNGAVWEVLDIVHDPTNADTAKRIFVRRTVINDSSVVYSWPARSDYVAVRLEAETFT